MGLDSELAGKAETPMGVLANKEIGVVSKDPQCQFLRSTSIKDDNIIDKDATVKAQTVAIDGSGDVEINTADFREATDIGMEVNITDFREATDIGMEVNITDFTETSDIGMVKDDYQDETENSSSFCNTDSGMQNGSVLSDSEVQSVLHNDPVSSAVVCPDDEVFPMRNKKLTAHWRNYIRSLMWRCKWIELQMKEFQSQASKYDRELAKCNQSKQFDLERFGNEETGAKSLPFYHQNKNRTIVKRKKRKRIEDTADVAAYMLHHNMFSYYEKKRSAGNVVSMDDGCGNLDATSTGKVQCGADDEWPSIEFSNSDSSLEEILWKIGLVQTQVHKLKARVDKVLSENSQNFLPADNLKWLLPCDASIGSSPFAVSQLGNGDETPAEPVPSDSSLVPDHEIMPDVALPKSVVRSSEKTMPHPDKIGCRNRCRFGGSMRNRDVDLPKSVIRISEKTMPHPDKIRRRNHQFVISKTNQDVDLPRRVVRLSERPTPRLDKIRGRKHRQFGGSRKHAGNEFLLPIPEEGLHNVEVGRIQPTMKAVADESLGGEKQLSQRVGSVSQVYNANGDIRKLGMQITRGRRTQRCVVKS